MEQKDFEKGQILYSLWSTGEVDMCVFDRGGTGNLFDSIHKTQFNPDGSFHSSFAKSLLGYFSENKYIQWQLATFEQIRKYGYEKHLDLSVQFPDIQPEKELDLKERLRWIALSEQLPPVGKDVVFARFEGQGVIWYAVNKAHEKFTGESTRSTHWCDCLPDAPIPTESRAVLEPKGVIKAKDLHAWAIPQTQEGVISTFEYKEPEPQPFTVTEDMWVEMDDLVRGLSIRIQMLSDKLKRKA